MYRVLGTVAAAAVVVSASGCARETGGAPVADAPSAPSTSATERPAASTSSATSATSAAAPTEAYHPGVVETTRVPLTPMARTCESAAREPGSQHVAFVSGAQPIIEILTPDGWTSTPSQAGPALDLKGPDGLTGTVTVAPTELGPAEAFDKYADDAMEHAPIASLSLLPAELCGYSGQKLMGTWSGGGGGPVQYRDRIAHVWTDAASYLVAIHVEGPQGAPGFGAAEELMMRDFGIQIP